METSPGTTRRARIRSSNGNISCCSVDACSADLSRCREYHKRHKVCEVHSKTPVVVVGGQEQRFCQQCSRFHALSEFDEGKRSCRKRLDGHNRRRRKPHLSAPNNGSLLATNYQGTRFSLHQQIHPAATMPKTSWVNFSEPDHRTLNTHCLPSHTPFLLQTEVDIDAGRAFSLLSSSSQSPHINLSPMMYAANKIPIGQPLIHNDSTGLYPCFHSSSCCASMTGMSCMRMGDGSVGSNLVSEANGTNLHCQDIFQVSSKVSFEGICETPTIHWKR